jgi:anti-sigma factor RsiW
MNAQTNCDQAQQDMVLAQYGELGDQQQLALDAHLEACEECRREAIALFALNEEFAFTPLDPTPNQLTAARLRLDEALDGMPSRSFGARVRANFFRWVGTAQTAPALMVLVLGAGFVGGTALTRYQVSKIKPAVEDMVLTHTTRGAISSVSGIVQVPNTDVVQVNYNRIVPETIQGSLDDPQIRQMLLLGTRLAVNDDVHLDSVALLAGECAAGHRCDGASTTANAEGMTTPDIRTPLLREALYDESPAARLNALKGLKPYVAQDQRVRNTLLAAVTHDPSVEVREEALSLLKPVQADFSVRQTLRTVSTDDVNPAIRNASYQVLQNSSDIW